MARGFTILGQIKEDLFQNGLYKTTMTPMPLFSESDFTMMEKMGQNSNCPILFNFNSHYLFLEHLINIAFDSLKHLKFVLVKLSFPAGGKLPTTLLNSKVLITIDFSAELQHFHQTGYPCLAIQDSIIRTRSEIGSNKVRIQYTEGNTYSSTIELKESLQNFVVKVKHLNVNISKIQMAN